MQFVTTAAIMFALVSPAAFAEDAVRKPMMISEAKLPEGFPGPGPVGEVITKTYPAHRLARVRSGDRGNDGSFMKLFRHIERNEIAMTAPGEMEMAAADGGAQSARVAKVPVAAICLLLAAIFGINFSSTAILLNLFLHLQDIGLSPAGAAGGLSLVFVTGLVGKVLVGAAAERWGVYRVWSIMQVILLVGAMLLALSSPAVAIPGLLVLGLGWAGCYVLTQVVISDVFAGSNLGKIAGGFIVFEAISSGSGVWSAAALFDAYGSYRFAFELCCGLLTMAIVATMLFRRSIARHDLATAHT